MSEDLGDLLQKTCIALVSDPKLQPEYDIEGNLLTTHCNQAAVRVAKIMGCDEFDAPNLLADDLYNIMTLNASKCWRIAGGQEATLHALGGGLAYAASTSLMLNEAHGHIAVICPLGMQKSGSLDKDVPIVANVGKGDPGGQLGPSVGGVRKKKNWICKVSQAFPPSKGEPSYFAWTPKEENANANAN